MAAPSTSATSFCPFVEAPFKECFCYSFNSHSNVKMAILVCNHNFAQCDIFQAKRPQTAGEAQHETSSKMEK